MHFRKPTIINRKLSLLIGNKCYFRNVVTLIVARTMSEADADRDIRYIRIFSLDTNYAASVYTYGGEAQNYLRQYSAILVSRRNSLLVQKQVSYLTDTGCSCLLSVSTTHRLILCWSHWLINCSIKNDLYKHLRNVF